MILHVDMDAFYASVEVRDDPSLADQPVIVGGSPTGRGVVSAANYLARKYGVHSAMPTSRAVQLCPQAVLVRPRMDRYTEISREIHSIFHRFTPEVEPLSLDEAFLDVSGSQKLFGSAEQIGRELKAAIFEETDLIASVGVAPNKFLAKLASDLDKPDGFTVVPLDGIQEFLAPLSIARMWGVGKVTQRKLESFGLTTFGQLQHLSEDQVHTVLGRMGVHFWRLAHGMDSRRVVNERRAKSISNESTFSADIEEAELLEPRLLELTEQVATRLRASNYACRTIGIKIRYSDFHTITRARKLAEPTASTDELWKVVLSLFRENVRTRTLAIRLIGVSSTGLSKGRTKQFELFDDSGNASPKCQMRSGDLDTATDQVREIFGRNALVRASTMNSDRASSRPVPNSHPAATPQRNDEHQGTQSPRSRDRQNGARNQDPGK